MISRKTQVEFLKKTASLYRNAAKIHGGEGIIVRGRQRCISGKFEDEFAKLILEHVICKARGWRIFVDYPIAIPKKRSRNQSKYIDFMLCKKLDDDTAEVMYMAEIKLDTGWMRNNIYKVARGLERSLKELRNRDDISSKEEDCICNDDRLYFNFSDLTLYDLIILSAANNGRDTINLALRRVEKNLSATTRIFFLTDQSVNVKVGCPCPCKDFSILEKRIRDCKENI